ERFVRRRHRQNRQGRTHQRRPAAQPPAANGWFLNAEDRLGTIETGKLADLIVLSHDYFDPSAVSDLKIKEIHPVLTVVGGKVVHDEINDDPPRYWDRQWRRDHGLANQGRP